MNEQRLSAAEVVEELRSSLDKDTGWIPALADVEGANSLPEGVGLTEVAEALRKFASAGIPTSVARQLKRAAESAESALIDDDRTYGHLGAAYAYVLQARRAASEIAP
ncbi:MULTISPECIES: hypothetical protein [Streptomyces]|uniref:hypothetical protein n=1 Tax=Streptomyces TaxID=1883 RepID=UPI0005BBCB03|nr:MULTISPECIES: hypothetical protein [Streptomyces]MDP9954235.1 hypothetical protein [Streptomyces sp. DSM 41269]MDP9954264.1 hypothetical protein [Streptomyces sp. DSM 41269]